MDFLFSGARVYRVSTEVDDVLVSACGCCCNASGVESMRMHVGCICNADTHAACLQAYLTPAHTVQQPALGTCLSALSACLVPYIATRLSYVAIDLFAMGRRFGGENQHPACSYGYQVLLCIRTLCLYCMALTGHGDAAAAVVGVE